METLLSRSAWAKFPVFRQKAFFSLKRYSYLLFLKFKFEISASKLTPVPNFSQIGQNIREAGILTWNDTESCLMTSYLAHSDDISKIIIDFVSEYHHAKFSGNWTANKGKTGGTMCPQAYVLPKYPSLNRVKVL